MSLLFRFISTRTNLKTVRRSNDYTALNILLSLLVSLSRARYSLLTTLLFELGMAFPLLSARSLISVCKLLCLCIQRRVLVTILPIRVLTGFSATI